jgi:hypothetical protein
MDVVQVGELVGGILVVCEAVKRAGLRAKYIPLLSAVLGVAGAVYFGGPDLLAAGAGVLVGLGTTLGYREVKSALVD